MSEETKFIDGLRAFPKHQNAPDFVLADLSLEREVLYKWLENNYKGEKYIKAQLLMSRDGNPYVKINDYKPQAQPSFEQPQHPQAAGSITTDDIPF